MTSQRAALTVASAIAFAARYHVAPPLSSTSSASQPSRTTSATIQSEVESLVHAELENTDLTGAETEAADAASDADAWSMWRPWRVAPEDDFQQLAQEAAAAHALDCLRIGAGDLHAGAVEAPASLFAVSLSVLGLATWANLTSDSGRSQWKSTSGRPKVLPLLLAAFVAIAAAFSCLCSAVCWTFTQLKALPINQVVEQLGVVPVGVACCQLLALCACSRVNALVLAAPFFLRELLAIPDDREWLLELAVSLLAALLAMFPVMRRIMPWEGRPIWRCVVWQFMTGTLAALPLWMETLLNEQHSVPVPWENAPRLSLFKVPPMVVGVIRILLGVSGCCWRLFVRMRRSKEPCGRGQVKLTSPPRRNPVMRRADPSLSGRKSTSSPPARRSAEGAGAYRARSPDITNLPVQAGPPQVSAGAARGKPAAPPTPVVKVEARKCPAVVAAVQRPKVLKENIVLDSQRSQEDKKVIVPKGNPRRALAQCVNGGYASSAGSAADPILDGKDLMCQGSSAAVRQSRPSALSIFVEPEFELPGACHAEAPAPAAATAAAPEEAPGAPPMQRFTLVSEESLVQQSAQPPTPAAQAPMLAARAACVMRENSENGCVGSGQLQQAVATASLPAWQAPTASSAARTAPATARRVVAPPGKVGQQPAAACGGGTTRERHSLLPSQQGLPSSTCWSDERGAQHASAGPSLQGLASHLEDGHPMMRHALLRQLGTLRSLKKPWVRGDACAVLDRLENTLTVDPCVLRGVFDRLACGSYSPGAVEATRALRLAGRASASATKEYAVPTVVAALHLVEYVVDTIAKVDSADRRIEELECLSEELTALLGAEGGQLIDACAQLSAAKLQKRLGGLLGPPMPAASCAG
eukprot:gnl/TRDRNA2_/TRDRNA2_184755_c0_seq1.p1 gnl/TRDRNA2_/TRDRNA2_184755_c0~~gnl/TRDRNA2_/TRDRNA2_184755_c0_seq1.p1  ORF type:complete len:869 (+),score=133.85 gnl/TRDRNA2_/TRDRNA2_184755_c0_seq1:77-2683(+)